MPATPADRGRLAPASSAPAAGERTETLCSVAGTTVEHIVSAGGVRSEVYDQDHAEWVLLLEGRATLEVAGEMVELAAGDWVRLDAGLRHQVTDTAAGTRWLAVHLPA